MTLGKNIRRIKTRKTRKTSRARKTRRIHNKKSNTRRILKGGVGNGFYFDFASRSAGKSFFRNKENRIYSDYLNGKSYTPAFDTLILSPLHKALRKLSQNIRLTPEEIQLILNFINDCTGLSSDYCEAKKILLLKIKENKGESLNENEKQQLINKPSQGAPTHIYVYPQ